MIYCASRTDSTESAGKTPENLMHSMRPFERLRSEWEINVCNSLFSHQCVNIYISRIKIALVVHCDFIAVLTR